MSTVRDMLVELTGVTDYRDAADDSELRTLGIDSGDLVRLVLLIEQRTGAEVTPADLDGLSTLADYERFVTQRAAAASDSGVA